MVTDRINSNLSALYDIEDPIYKSLICDKDGTIPSTITKPTDRDIGVIASQIEYLRQAAIYFLQQIYIDEAGDEFLKYQLETFFNSYRLENETNEEWIQRTFVTIFQQKVSKASIIFALTPYSSLTPVVNTISLGSGYADFSFADTYVDAEVIFEGETIIVLPAIAESDSSSFFTIRIILYDTPSEDIFTVQSIIEKTIAAGIIYILEIQYT